MAASQTQKMISATASSDSKGMIEIKIELEEQNRSTKMRFTQNMTIAECLKDIWEKIGQKQKDHGLFYPGEEGNKKRRPTWLENARRLGYYGLHDQDTLIYKKKHRPFKYKLIDGTQKTLIVDESLTVEAIVQAVAKHVGLKEDAVTEFGLRRENDKKSWLVGSHTLQEEEITPNDVLCFARQFFGLSIDQSDPFQMELMYLQSKDSILSDEYPCSKKEAVEFAALQFQITFGDHDPNKHKPGFLNLDLFLPSQWKKERGIEQDILTSHKKLYATPASTAKYKYYQLMRTLKSFGFSIFSVQQTLQFEDKRKEGRMKFKTRNVRLAISREEILIYSLENAVLHEWELWKLRSYQCKHSIVVLDFGDHENDLIRLTTDQASKIIDLISGYIELILRVHQDKGYEVTDDQENEAAVEDYDPTIDFTQNAQIVMTGALPGTTHLGSHVFPGSMFDNQLPNNVYNMGSAVGGQGGAMMSGAQVDGLLGSAAFGGFKARSDTVKVMDLPSAMKATRYLSDELGSVKVQWKVEPNLNMANTQAQLMTDKTQLVDGIMSLLGKVKADPSALSRSGVDMQCAQIAANVRAVSAGCRNMNSLVGERNGRPLMAGALSVASSIADMFAVLQTVMNDPNDISSVIGLAGVEKALQNSQMLLESVKPEHFVDEGALKLMTGCIAEVQSNMALLIQNAELCAEHLPPEEKEKFLVEAKKLEARTGWLFKSASELAPVVLCEPANNELNRIRVEIKDLTNRFMTKSAGPITPNNPNYGTLYTASTAVSDALKHLLEATKTSESGGIDGIVDFATPVSMLQSSLGELRSALAEPACLVEAEKQIAAGPLVIPVAKLLEYSNVHLERAEKKREEEREKLEAELALLEEEERKLRADGSGMETESNTISNTLLSVSAVPEMEKKQQGTDPASLSQGPVVRPRSSGPPRSLPPPVPLVGSAPGKKLEDFTIETVEGESLDSAPVPAPALGGAVAGHNVEAPAAAIQENEDVFTPQEKAKIQRLLEAAKQSTAKPTPERQKLVELLQEASGKQVQSGTMREVRQKLMKLGPTTMTATIPISEFHTFVEQEGNPPTTLRTDPLIKLTKDVARSGNDVTAAVKKISVASPDDVRERLKAEALQLSNGVKELVQQSRVLFKDPTNPMLVSKTAAIVQRLDGCVHKLIADAGERSAQSDLRFAAKVTCAECLKLLNQVSNIAPYVDNPEVLTDLQEISKTVANALTDFMSEIQSASQNPKDFIKQIDLLEGARKQTGNFNMFLNKVKIAAKEIEDQTKKQELLESAGKMNEYLSNLMNSIVVAGDITGQNKIEAALEDFDAVKVELDTAEFAAMHGELPNIPGQTRENALELLSMATKAHNQSIEAIVQAAIKGDKLPIFISGCAASIAQVGAAVRAVACTVTDREAQTRVISAAKDLTMDTLSLISMGRVLAVDCNNNEKKENLQKAQKSFTTTVAALLAAPKGFDSREINDAIEMVSGAAAELKMVEKQRSTPVSEIEYKESATTLASAAKALSSAVAQFTALALTSPQGFGPMAKVMSATTRQLISACSSATGLSKDQREVIQENALSTIDGLKDLLNFSKAVAADKNAQTLSDFKGAEAAVKNSIAALVQALGSTSQEMEDACSSIGSLIDLLQDQNYADVPDADNMKLVESFIKSMQNLNRLSAALNKASKVSAAKVGQVSKEMAYTIEDMVSASRMASKKAWNFTPLQAKMISATREIKDHPLNSRKVIALAKGLTLATRVLIQEAATTCEPGTEREQKVSKSLTQLMNALNRLTGAAQLSLSHKPVDIATLITCVDTLEQQLKDISPLINTCNIDDVLTPSLADTLSQAARTVCLAATGNIRAAAALGLDENNEMMEEALKASNNTLNEASQDLVKACGVLNPSVRECDAAQKTLAEASSALEAAMLDVSLGKFNITGVEKTLPEYQKESAIMCKALAETVSDLVEKAALGDIQPVAAAASKIQEDIPSMVKLAQLTAFCEDDSDSQLELLELAKGLADMLGNLVKTVKGSATGDLKLAAKVRDAGGMASDAIGRYLNELQSGAQVVSELESTVKMLDANLTKLEVPPVTIPGKRYAEFRTELGNVIKTVAVDARQVLTVDTHNKGEVGLSVYKLGETTSKLIDVSRHIVSTTQVEEVKVHIKESTTKITQEMTRMIHLVAETVQGQDRKEELRNSFQQISVHMPELMRFVKEGDMGEIMMDKTVAKLSDVIQLLNTSAMFVQAGQLEVDTNNKEFEGLTLLTLQEKLKKTSEEVAGICNEIADSAKAVNSEDLGKATEKLAVKVNDMSKVALHNVIKLPSITAQSELLGNVKNMTTNTHRLVLAAKEVNERPNESGSQKMLSDTQHSVRVNLGDILKTMETAGAEMLRGERVLNSVKAQIENLVTNIPTLESSSPQEVITAARVVIGATSDLSLARTQDEVIAAGKKAYSGIEGVLSSSKTVAVKLSPDQTISDKILTSSKETAKSLCAHLEVSKLDRQEEATGQKLEASSHTVTISINDLVAALRLLPNTEHLKLEEEVVDNNNLETLAESELRKCADIIEKAANTLLSFKPREQPKADPTIIDESDINEAILTATKAIAGATHKLVVSAEVAQHDRRENAASKKGAVKYHADPAWANGLISAAQEVSGAVQHLVKAANDSVEGKAQEEALVSTARAVAAATAHLVSASKAKADPNSESIKNLSVAAKLVANATSKMVDAANQASKFKEEAQKDDEITTTFKAGMGNSKIQELEIQTKIAQLERQLEQERQKLARMRKARYAKK